MQDHAKNWIACNSSNFRLKSAPAAQHIGGQLPVTPPALSPTTEGLLLGRTFGTEPSKRLASRIGAIHQVVLLILPVLRVVLCLLGMFEATSLRIGRHHETFSFRQ